MTTPVRGGQSSTDGEAGNEPDILNLLRSTHVYVIITRALSDVGLEP